MKPKDPKPKKSKCVYCYGHGLDAGFARCVTKDFPNGYRVPNTSAVKDSVPCDRCGK